MIDGTIVEIPHTLDEVRAMVLESLRDPCVEAFHTHWYRAHHTWGMTRWRGVPLMKCPMDMQIVHEIIQTVRPSLVIETGTAYGGSALYYADCQQMAGINGHVLSIDLSAREPIAVDAHRITFHRGSSLALDALMLAHDLTEQYPGPVLVSLDSDHSRVHVAAELAAYSEFVTVGSFLIVEDTNIGGHPIQIGLDDGGPMAAVTAFLATHPAFEREPAAERYMLSMHPGGWLRKRGD